MPLNLDKPARFDAGHVPITEELDSARWSLPPVVPVLIAALVIGGILTAYLVSVSHRPPTSTGTVIGYRAVPIHNVSARSIATGQMGTIEGSQEITDRVLTAVSISITNATEKPMYIKSAEVQLIPAQGDPMSDEGAGAFDMGRVFSAYPELKQGALDAIMPETKLAPGQTLKGTILSGFNLTRDKWDSRKGLKAVVNLYDHAPLTLDVPATAGQTTDTKSK